LDMYSEGDSCYDAAIVIRAGNRAGTWLRGARCVGQTDI
jgi:hypothetical protein